MKKHITTIELTGAHIKVLQARVDRGKHLVTFCDARPMDAADDSKTAGTLKEMLAALPAGAGEVIMLVARRQVIVRQMNFPSSHDDEIRDMIGLQLLNNIPFPFEEVIYQHKVLDCVEKGVYRVLAVIINKKVSERYCRLLQNAGIKDGKLVPGFLGVGQWVAFQEKAHHVRESRPMAVLNMDKNHSELCFCRAGHMYFSRALLFGWA